jgi:hypothetical protein
MGLAVGAEANIEIQNIAASALLKSERRQLQRLHSLTVPAAGLEVDALVPEAGFARQYR